jgi:hypothetical protein
MQNKLERLYVQLIYFNSILIKLDHGLDRNFLKQQLVSMLFKKSPSSQTKWPTKLGRFHHKKFPV